MANVPMITLNNGIKMPAFGLGTYGVNWLSFSSSINSFCPLGILIISFAVQQAMCNIFIVLVDQILSKHEHRRTLSPK